MPLRSTFIAISLTLLLSTTTFAAIKQSYTIGNFALELDGNHAGYVTGVAGGFASGNVIEEPESPDYFIKKHLNDPPGYSDITIEIGTGMSSGTYRWIKDVLNGSLSIRKSGAIVAMDQNRKILRRLDFANAQITRISFPDANASSGKLVATIKLTLTPATTFLSSPGGTYATANTKAQKNMNSANFRLAIKGLDTSGAIIVEGLDIPIPLTAHPDAACSICTPVIPKINFPNVEIVGSEAGAATWFPWHQTFVIAGQHADSDEKSGTLEFMDATLKNTIMSISFTGLGITSIATDTGTSNVDTIGKVRATMYVEKITLDITP